MLTYEASAKIIEKHPWLNKYESDLKSCITSEAEFWHGRERGGASLRDFPDAVVIAFDLMLEWIERAHEFHVDVDDLEDVARFVAGHRQSCVWAIFISRHQHRQ